jgi:excisionase family DNA binding protein
MKLHSIKESCDHLGIGRTSMYALIAAGELVAVKIGRRTLISAQSLESFVRAAEKDARLRRRCSAQATTNTTGAFETTAAFDDPREPSDDGIVSVREERSRGI